MSDVFSNASFDVKSVMVYTRDDDSSFKAADCYIQRKPSSDYVHLTRLRYESGGGHGLALLDFQVQARFDANVAVQIQSDLDSSTTADEDQWVYTNSAISTASYDANGVQS